jgi:hypothetical protein
MKITCATFIVFASCAMSTTGSQAGILGTLAKGIEHDAVKVENNAVKLEKPGVNIENGVKFDNHGKQSLSLGGGGGGAGSSESQSSGVWTLLGGAILAVSAIGFHCLSRLRSATSA